MYYNWIKLDTNTFIRQYGNYFYLFNQVTKAEILLKNAFFLKRISRTFIKTNKIYDEILFSGDLKKKEMQQTYDPILSELVEGGFLIALDSFPGTTYKDVTFSYSHLDDSDSKPNFEGVDNPPMQLLEDYFLKNPIPFELCIDLTKMCNERCVHCYHFKYDKTQLPLSKISEVLKEFRDLGGLKVKFTGGECMLHPDFISCLQIARDNDLSISVLSNLTCCTSKIIKALQKNRISQLQVSLYSMRAEIHDKITQRVGSFKKTMRAILDLYSANIPVQIHCPLLKINYPYWKEVQEYGKKMSMKTTFSPELIVRADHNQNNTQYELTNQEIISFLNEYDPIAGKTPKKTNRTKIKDSAPNFL